VLGFGGLGNIVKRLKFKMDIMEQLKQMKESDKRTEELNQKPQKTEQQIKRAYIGSLTRGRK